MALYRLPFEDDGLWTLGASNWDHSTSSSEIHAGMFAWDFLHPKNGKILAARAGVVIEAREDLANGNNASDCTGGGNYVAIRHGDGTVACYPHVTQNGVRVQVGAYVFQGQHIADVGETGNATGPHTHFAVYAFWDAVSNPQSDCATYGQTLLINFEDKNHSSWRPVGRNSDPNYMNSNNGKELWQDGWRQCQKCQVLYFAPNGGGVCKVGGKHIRGDYNYMLLANNPTGAGQENWRYCTKCSGLFFAGGGSSTCPASGKHVGNGNYALMHHTSNTSGIANWWYCHKCSELFYGPSASQSRCPGDNGIHDASKSDNYALKADWAILQEGWRHCAKCRGLFFGGNPVSKCPAGNAHNAATREYIMMVDAEDAPGQPRWRWCVKCGGLWFGDNAGSICPVSGSHEKTGSGNYRVSFAVPRSSGERGWQWCKRCQGLWLPGSSASVCPPGGRQHLASTGGQGYALQFGRG